MNINCRTITFAIGIFAAPFLAVPACLAECGGIPQAAPSNKPAPRDGSKQMMGASILKVADQTDSAPAGASIVGFWHVKFVSQGSTGIPDGTEIDAGYSQWHSDGTEIMNSGGRPPNTSNFCLGVWTQAGPQEFVLNHYATGWDPTGTTLIGPANIREDVVLGPNGLTFAGTFAINQYDETLAVQAHVQGVITGTRITVVTPPSSIF